MEGTRFINIYAAKGIEHPIAGSFLVTAMFDFQGMVDHAKKAA